MIPGTHSRPAGINTCWQVDIFFVAGFLPVVGTFIDIADAVIAISQERYGVKALIMTRYLRFEFDNIHQRVPDYIETSHEVRATWRIKLLTSSGQQKTLLEIDCNTLRILTWIVEEHTGQSMEYFPEVREGT